VTVGMKTIEDGARLPATDCQIGERTSVDDAFADILRYCSPVSGVEMLPVRFFDGAHPRQGGQHTDSSAQVRPCGDGWLWISRVRSRPAAAVRPWSGRHRGRRRNRYPAVVARFLDPSIHGVTGTSGRRRRGDGRAMRRKWPVRHDCRAASGWGQHPSPRRRRARGRDDRRGWYPSRCAARRNSDGGGRR
jgi:hypothetical protein